MATTMTMTETKLPRLVTPLPGPEAKRQIERDAKYVSPAFTRDYPFVAKRGFGAMVEDVDGNIFLDLGAGVAVCSTGHCHPEVVAAIQKQAAELIHMCEADFYYPHLAELGTRLEPLLPKGQAWRFYCGNSGADAVEAAMKLARWATKRDKIIAFYGCFHGRTMGALSLTSSKAVQRKGFGALVPGVLHIPYPNVYRRPAGTTAEAYAVECATFLEREIFPRIADPSEVAAIFVEPIQGEGGYLVAPPEFLRELERICRKHGILLVCDEVQSGVGRTGKWWAFEEAGITPDVILMAKGIASGMPLSVMAARADLMTWPPGAHASTFGGNPVAIAAALASLDLIEKKYMDNARRVGDFFLAKFGEWTKTHRTVGDVRGRGLMIGIEFVKDKATKEPARDFRDAVIHRAYEKGVLLIACGQNVVRVCPPLVIDQEQAAFAVETLDGIIRELEAKM